MRLEPEYAPAFYRDIKRLKKKHVDTSQLGAVIRLVCENTKEAKDELRRRNGMHKLHGEWEGSTECHVANAGDWLAVWAADSELVVFQRTGTHKEIFG